MHTSIDRNTDGVEANDLRGAANFAVGFGLIRVNGFAGTAGEIAIVRDRNSIELDGVGGESTIGTIDSSAQHRRDQHDSTNEEFGFCHNRDPAGMGIPGVDAVVVC